MILFTRSIQNTPIKFWYDMLFDFNCSQQLCSLLSAKSCMLASWKWNGKVYITTCVQYPVMHLPSNYGHTYTSITHTIPTPTPHKASFRHLHLTRVTCCVCVCVCVCVCNWVFTDVYQIASAQHTSHIFTHIHHTHSPTHYPHPTTFLHSVCLSAQTCTMIGNVLLLLVSLTSAMIMWHKANIHVFILR